MNYYFLWLTLLSLAINSFNHLIYSHGFSGNTYVRLYNPNLLHPPQNLKNPYEVWQYISQLYEHKQAVNITAKSYDLVNNRWTFLPIKKVGKSETNCYMHIQFNQSHYDDLKCTPSQEFYDHDQKCWIAACQLYPGQNLLREDQYGETSYITIIDIKLVEEPLTIYTLEIADLHIYLVSGNCIVTHNTELDNGLYYAIIEAFCSGAAGGGAIGSSFGPEGTCCGLLIGGIIAIGISFFCKNWDQVWYKLKYDIAKVLLVFNTVQECMRKFNHNQNSTLNLNLDTKNKLLNDH